MNRTNIEIVFNNYQESDYSKTKRFKNLRKLVFLFAQAIYALYLSLFSIIRSRIFFIKDENFTEIKNKIYFNSYTQKSSFFEKDRIENLTNSFNLKVSSLYYYEGFFKKNVTKSGLMNYIYYDAFLKLCLEKYYDEDFCYSKFHDLEVKVLDIEDSIFLDDFIANIGSTMEVFVSIKNKTGDVRVKRILEDRNFVKYINDTLNKELPFIHVSGISLLGD